MRPARNIVAFSLLSCAASGNTHEGEKGGLTLNLPHLHGADHHEHHHNVYHHPQTVQVKQQHITPYFPTPIVEESLPFCESGTEYASVQRGGNWVEDTSHVANFFHNPPKDMSTLIEPDYNCLEVRDFKEIQRWKPSCQPRPVASNTKTPRVLIFGDSLNRQIFQSCSLQNGQAWNDPSCEMNGISYNVHFTGLCNLNVAPFLSEKAPQCSSIVNADPSQGGQFEPMSMETLMEIMDQEYDYIIFNAYTWFGKLVPALQSCYLSTPGVTQKDLTEDILSFYQAQLETLASVVREKLPKSKLYYRTASTHPNHLVDYRPDGTFGFPSKPLETPQRRFTKEDCFSPEGLGFGLFMCVSYMNDMAISIFEKYGHSILDTQDVIEMRPDAQVWQLKDPAAGFDSLHLCVPGPPSTLLEAVEAEVAAREWDKQHAAEFHSEVKSLRGV